MMDAQAQRYVDCIAGLFAAILILHVMSIREQHPDVKKVAQHQAERDRALAENDALTGQLQNVKAELNQSESQSQRLNRNLMHYRSAYELATSTSAELESDKAGLQGQLTNSQQIISHLTAFNQRFAAELEDLAKLQKRQARDVVGLAGEFKRTVFVVDTSASMATKKYPQHKERLSLWIQLLDFEQFNVIAFADKAIAWKPGWQDATAEMRNAAAEYIGALEAGGNTATHSALLTALSMGGVDTIVLFSDGAPTGGEYPKILEDIQAKNQNGVTINVVAIGNYFEADYGTFLSLLAEQNGGQFIGR